MTTTALERVRGLENDMYRQRIEAMRDEQRAKAKGQIADFALKTISSMRQWPALAAMNPNPGVYEMVCETIPAQIERIIESANKAMRAIDAERGGG